MPLPSEIPADRLASTNHTETDRTPSEGAARETPVRGPDPSAAHFLDPDFDALSLFNPGPPDPVLPSDPTLAASQRLTQGAINVGGYVEVAAVAVNTRVPPVLHGSGNP